MKPCTSGTPCGLIYGLPVQGSVEVEAGVSGYRETLDTLEKVSAAKSELDEVKGRTLEDMSEMVRHLNYDIAGRRDVLAPVLREIRPLRERVKVCVGTF